MNDEYEYYIHTLTCSKELVEHVQSGMKDEGCSARVHSSRPTEVFCALIVPHSELCVICCLGLKVHKECKVQLQFTFYLLKRLKSNAETDLTPGIWNPHPSEELLNSR
ncbi:hypothetical protein J6590_007786 [Homalodisca vitripennis]|nr:hypothetical protein J6590_007786 [Homalodisca vitripennis]